MSLAGAALLVAIIGVVLAAGSLIWQITVFIASGHRVKFALMLGYVDREPLKDKGISGGTAEVATSAKRWAQMENLRSHPDQYLFVVGVNSGRAGVYVDSIGFSTGDHAPIVMADGHPADQQEMPTYLEAGQSKKWRFPLANLPSLWELGAADSECVHAMVGLGTGRTIRTKEGVRVGLLRGAADR